MSYPGVVVHDDYYTENSWKKKKKKKKGRYFKDNKFANAKYEAQKFRLFHRFNEGIRMDDEMWFSVTPEKIAAHIANRFSAINAKVVTDPFCGAAGNSIQFALKGIRTIGIEICASRMAIAQNNARVYGADKMIEFINGDAYEVLPMLQGLVDGVFISAPWGGPDYIHSEYFDLNIFAKAMDIARKVSPNVAMLVPRNISHEEAHRIFGPCEIEYNYLGRVLKTVTLYFGGLIRLENERQYG